MTSTSSLHTYGIFSARPTVINLKKDKEIGWVADIKWAFVSAAIRERKFQLEHMALLRSAVKADGIKVECTPTMEGTPLEPVMVPTTQRGNITISDDGEVVVTTRIVMDHLEERGIPEERFTAATRKVFSAIYLLPGLNVRQVARVAQLHPTTVSHQLPVLADMQLIGSQWRGSERLLTPAGWTL